MNESIQQARDVALCRQGDQRKCVRAISRPCEPHHVERGYADAARAAQNRQTAAQHRRQVDILQTAAHDVPCPNG